ncbi:hypothetical protein EW145_g1448 [Phellinidium pouzarii]|uniref:Uncharacterized protein n=1 Tax=Phellinidium pouzarii TaxID=167371 RepID=A0A4S4LGB9_9AGAM|nr:hypothetical protein EW145_g1448 [Phellinidium pouzarii]
MLTTSTLEETLIAETMDLITKVYSDHVISRSLLHGAPERSVNTEPIKEGLRKFFKDARSDAEKESANLKEIMNDMVKAQESVCRQTERAVGSTRSLAELLKKTLQDSRQDDKKREENARDLEKHMVIKMGKFMVEQYNKGLVNILGYGISFANGRKLAKVDGMHGNLKFYKSAASITPQKKNVLVDAMVYLKLAKEKLPLLRASHNHVQQIQKKLRLSPVDWATQELALVISKFKGSCKTRHHKLDNSFTFISSKDAWEDCVVDFIRKGADDYYLTLFKADIESYAFIMVKSMFAVIDSDTALTYIFTPMERESANAIAHPNFRSSRPYMFRQHNLDNVVQFNEEGHPVFKKDLFSQAIIDVHIEEVSEAQGENVKGINEEIDEEINEDLLSLEVNDIFQADDLNSFSHGKVEIGCEAWRGRMWAAIICHSINASF